MIRAFAPGRVNLIGEHTDYNGGLALPFAIERGVTVEAEPAVGDRVEVLSEGFGADEFSASDPGRAAGWRAFARGVVAELGGVPGCRVTVRSDLPAGAGLASSAALCVALALALGALRGHAPGEPLDLARACARVENDWAGAPTGLLDQLAILHGGAVLIDFASLEVERVPLALPDGWRLAVVDSGSPRELAESGYAERRRECEEARVRLGLVSLRDAVEADLGALPPLLARRVRHVIEENERVRSARKALAAGEGEMLGELLDASHAGLRDLYECSTPEVEAAVARSKAAGAAGARMVGGGFGGSVLMLLGPGSEAPAGAVLVEPATGARVEPSV